MSAKVLVTGATGFVGGEIIQRLHRDGSAIRFLARNPSSSKARKAVAEFGAEAHPGDVTDPASLREAVKGVDAVVHLVGIITEVGHVTFENVHTQGTLNVVAAAKNAGLKRFVHMSALGTRPGAVSRYHQTKWDAEEAVRHSGLDYTIFRPSLIYGPGDHFTNLFASIIRFSPVVPLLGSPTAKFQPIEVECVAKAFAGSLNELRSFGQTCDLCGPETFTFAGMLDEMMRVMGRRRMKLQLPSWLARCQAAFLEFLFPTLLRRAPPLNRDQLIMLNEDNIGDGQPAIELFGVRPGPFRDGLASYLPRG